MVEAVRAGIPSWVRRVLLRALPVVGDVALYVFGALFSALVVFNVPGATRLVEDTFRLQPVGLYCFLACLMAWLSVFVRKKVPLAPLVAGAVLTAIGTDYLLLMIGSYHAALVWPTSRRRRLIITVTGVVLLFVLREVLTEWGDNGRLIASITQDGVLTPEAQVAYWVMATALASLSLLVTFGSATLVHARRESRVNSKRADQEHSRATSLSSELNRVSERERLARDVHDALAHRLAIISLQSGALEQSTRSQDVYIAKAAETLRQQAHASLEDLRSLLGELRSEPSNDDGFEAAAPPSLASIRAVGHLIRSVRDAGTPVDAFVLIEDAEKAGAALDRTAYRIVQECLTNSLKHAPGAPIEVYLEASATSGVRVRVSNPLLDSIKSDTPGAGRGTAGIRERAELLGGTAWIGEHDRKFIVDVSLPWSGEK